MGHHAFLVVPAQVSPIFPLAPKIFDGSSRQVDAGAVFLWLRQGSLLFLARPGLWLGAAALALFIACASLLAPLAGSVLLVVGLSLQHAGMQNLCRALSEERELRFSSFFSGFFGKFNGLLLIGAVTALLLCCALWCGEVLSSGMSGAPARVLRFFIAFVLSIPVLLAAGFAPVLHLFNDMPPLPAMRSSFQACASNWRPLLVLAVVFLLLAFIALLSAGLGLLVVIPIASGVLYAAYRDIFPGT